jgi:hypothetical protein
MGNKESFVHSTTGQLTVVGLLLMFLTLIVMAHLMPTIISTSDNLSESFNNSGYTTEALLARLPGLFLIVAFLATIAMYAGPQLR